jgi:hypothetical protein
VLVMDDGSLTDFKARHCTTNDCHDYNLSKVNVFKASRKEKVKSSTDVFVLQVAARARLSYPNTHNSSNLDNLRSVILPFFFLILYHWRHYAAFQDEELEYALEYCKHLEDRLAKAGQLGGIPPSKVGKPRTCPSHHHEGSKVL